MGADARRKILITVRGGDVNEPIIYTIGKQFNVIPNIEGASIMGGVGIVAMELTGAQEEIDRVIAFLKEKGVQIETLD